MKAALISIQPKWCELIASGKKTVEVRKTKPKIETPFKCYIVESDCNLAYKGVDEHKSYKPIKRPPQSWCYAEEGSDNEQREN